MGPAYPSRQSLRAVATRMRSNKKRPQLPAQAPASRLPRKASPSHWLPLVLLVKLGRLTFSRSLLESWPYLHYDDSHIKTLQGGQFMHDIGGGLAREPDHASHVHNKKWEASPKDTTDCAGDSDASSKSLHYLTLEKP
ncbi:hypothetical protein OPV22_025875 [Ensete ventricosum]|uniref:Uncharacterized protein n=1 Tax=Ensete ventricosum TaxID=4639 RepID=A0AAV8Q935_ENSVE|nr:hypothetical protein OPV22_025875 [Ensete ventricosum]